MSKLHELVAVNPIFAQLSAAQREAIADRALPRKFEKGELITVYGEVWPYLFMVTDGKVDALKESSEGRRLIVMTLEPGDIFWGIAFFHGNAPTPVALEGRETGQLVLWSQPDLLPILMENGQALWELCRLMVTRMMQASQIIEGLAFQPVASRLARLMLERFGDTAATSVARDLTLDEMAALVGSTREMVCRILYRFADANLIEVTRTEFVLTDKEGLARLADQQ